MLQLFGLALVAKGLSDARVLFGRPPLTASIRRWFVRLWSALFRPPRTATLQADLGATLGLSGDLSLRKIPGSASTLEQRVEALERNLKELESEMRRDLDGFREHVGQIRTDVHREVRDRTDADRQIARRIEEFAVGGLHLEFVGMVWLLFGTLATSAPDETAAFISAAYRAL